MMKTASYYTYSGPGRIGISVDAPRGVPAGYRFYRKLAPRRDMVRLEQERYREIFFGEILAKLDAELVKDELELLAGTHEPVLLCFERPPFTTSNWCHRHMVAEWFKAELGIEVEELGPNLPELI